MEDPKLNHYWAKRVNVRYWSKADGFALPLFGMLLFGYLTWYGYHMKLLLVMFLTVPIALTCLIMLIADFYQLRLEERADEESSEPKQVGDDE